MNPNDDLYYELIDAKDQIEDLKALLKELEEENVRLRYQLDAIRYGD